MEGVCSSPIECHIGSEECSDGVPCCGGQACDPMSKTCPPSACQPTGETCDRSAECCSFNSGSGGCTTNGVCM